MKISPRFALLPLIALAFAGCGGDGDDNVTNSAFAGDYAGTYTSSLSDSGDVNATISSSGTVSATVTSTANAPLAGTVEGRVRNNGDFDGSLTYNSGSSSVRYTATGTLTRNSDNSITGTLTQTDGSNSATITISLFPDIVMESAKK